MKTASKKVIHKAAKATDEFLGNKIVNKIVKPSRYVEEIIIPPEKREEILRSICKTSIIKMEHFKISKLLNNSTVSKLITRKWTEVNYLSDCQYSTKKNIRFKTPMLRSDLCDYSIAYTVVKQRIIGTGTNNANATNKKLIFEECISKTNNTFIENVQDLDIVMPLYNL